MTKRVPIQQIPTILSEFMDRVLVPLVAAEPGPKSWLIKAGGIALASNSVNAINSMIPSLKTIGIIGDDGMIDLDRLYSIASETMKTTPLTIGQFKFGQPDVDTLRDIAMKYTTEPNQVRPII